MQHRFQLVLLGLVTHGHLTVGCGSGAVSYRYNVDYARPAPALATAGAVIPDVLDARGLGDQNVWGSPLEPGQIEGVRDAFREHVRRVGVVQERNLPAPRSPREVEGILQYAAQRGAAEVVFLRFAGSVQHQACASAASVLSFFGLAPGLIGLIIDAFPIGNHGASAAFEVFVIEPRTREVLARRGRIGSLAETVSPYGCGYNGPLAEVMPYAVQGLLEEVIALRQGGFPTRFRPPDATQYLLNSPPVHIEGGRVVGPGWSYAVPAGWQPLTDLAQMGATGLSDGIRIEVSFASTPHPDRTYGALTTVVRRANGATISAELDATLAQRGAVERELTMVTGLSAIERATAVDGLGIQMRCVGPPGVVAAHREECRAAMDSMHVDVVTRQ